MGPYPLSLLVLKNDDRRVNGERPDLGPLRNGLTFLIDETALLTVMAVVGMPLADENRFYG